MIDPGGTDKELIIVCDESDKDGKYFSNFYGGVLVGSSQVDRVTKRLLDEKSLLNIKGEIKWSKTSEAYLGKYKQLISIFFDEVKAGNVNVRIMFRQNAHEPLRLSDTQKETGYYRLYYQFIKHAFGLRHMPLPASNVHLRLYFDEFPDKPEHAERFKGFIFGLQFDDEFSKRHIVIRMQDIAEVRSHDHVLLQCLDVVLGAMAFRLNDKHKEKPVGQKRRGKRTVAKEDLYKHILSEIRTMRQGFNIGNTTGKDGDIVNLWIHPYRHWKFVPSEFNYNECLTKRGDKKQRQPN